jgi:hypothetical protein
MSELSAVAEQLAVMNQRLANIENSQEELGGGLARVLSQTREEIEEAKKNSPKSNDNRMK